MNLETMRGIMLSIGAARDTDVILDEIAEGVASCKNVALVRIWLIEESADERWLQLAASAGNLATGADPKRLDGRFARFEIGDRKIGTRRGHR